MNVIIREAKLSDLQEVSSLDVALFSNQSYPIFVLRQFLDISDGLFKVADVGGELAGYSLGHYSAEKSEGWVLSLGILPAYRSRQIGKKLTHALLDELKAKGAQRILLTVHPDNVPALKIYQKVGFTPSQLHPDYYLDNSPRLLMVKAF